MQIVLKTLEVGELIKVVKVRQGMSGHYLNQPLEIVQICSNYYSCKQKNSPNSGGISVYFDGVNVDIFYPLDREKEKKYLIEKQKNIEKELKKIIERVEMITKFPTEEDYLAHKLKEILKNKDDTAAIAEVLREMKKSNII